MRLCRPAYLFVKVALGQSVAHLPAAMSEQTWAFRQTAQASSGLEQVASQEKPGDSKSATPSPAPGKPPAPRKRVEKDD